MPKSTFVEDMKEAAAVLRTCAAKLGEIADRVELHGRQWTEELPFCDGQDVPDPPKKKEGKFDPLKVVLPHTEAAFARAWTEWVTFRRQKHCSLTPLTVDKQLILLGELTPAHAIATIEKSIEAGWQGLFPDKITANGQGVSFKQQDANRLMQNMAESAARVTDGG